MRSGVACKHELCQPRTAARTAARTTKEESENIIPLRQDRSLNDVSCDEGNSAFQTLARVFMLLGISSATIKKVEFRVSRWLIGSNRRRPRISSSRKKWVLSFFRTRRYQLGVCS